MSANPWAIFAHAPVEELTSHGFVWERKEKACQPYVPPPKCESRRGRKVRPEYSKAYRAAQRERWLALGIVRPRNAAEAAICERATHELAA